MYYTSEQLYDMIKRNKVREFEMTGLSYDYVDVLITADIVNDNIDAINPEELLRRTTKISECAKKILKDIVGFKSKF